MVLDGSGVVCAPCGRDPRIGKDAKEQEVYQEKAAKGG